MSKITTATCLPSFAKLQTPWQDVDSSFERLYLTAVVHFERPGDSTMPIKPSGARAISHAGSTGRRLVLLPASSKGSTKC